jgi:hypothetical protein
MKGKIMENNKRVTRFLAIFVMFSMSVSIVAPVANAQSDHLDILDDLSMPITINASHQIMATSASMSTSNNGNVTVAFSITGTGTMTEIGATRIEIFENDRLVAVFLNTSTSGMMASNKTSHAGTITYRGVTGRSYRATVSLRATNDNGTDSRARQTNTVVAR